jgi:1-acyl-sn-glycerol-3-phosphate acyltransferase
MKKLGRFLLGLMGWSLEDYIPKDLKTFVLIAAPHTSNMDFFVALPSLWALGIKSRYLIKKELFWWPLGSFLRATGGIPVDRSGTNKKFVQDLTNLLADADQLALLFTPEGTRSYAKRWKTGFYRIAHSLEVPIVLATADYEKKLVTVGDVFHTTGDVNKDLARLEEHYKNIAAKYPEKFNAEFFVREK